MMTGKKEYERICVSTLLSNNAIVIREVPNELRREECEHEKRVVKESVIDMMTDIVWRDKKERTHTQGTRDYMRIISIED
jgi:hypothetical protein